MVSPIMIIVSANIEGYWAVNPAVINIVFIRSLGLTPSGWGLDFLLSKKLIYF